MVPRQATDRSTPARAVSGGAGSRVGAGSCVMTFDDGPDPVWTPRVLGELRRSGLRATFFVLAARARRAPALIERMLVTGHDVELHGHAHLRHSEATPEELETDTDMALSLLRALGATPTRWRPPWGVRTTETERLATHHRLELVGWTFDTHDWRGDSPATMLRHARSQLRDGGVVLMHDALGPGARRTGCASTVALIAPLARTARERGMEPVALSALAEGQP